MRAKIVFDIARAKAQPASPALVPRDRTMTPSQPATRRSSATSRHKCFLICGIIYSIFQTPWILREPSSSEGGSAEGVFPNAPSRALLNGPHRAFTNNNPGASLTGAIPLWALRTALRSLERWNRSVTPALAEDDESFARAVRERRESYCSRLRFSRLRWSWLRSRLMLGSQRGSCCGRRAVGRSRTARRRLRDCSPDSRCFAITAEWWCSSVWLVIRGPGRARGR
jgi:hypothetical protein